MKASQNTLWILRRFQPQFWAMPKTYCKSVAEMDCVQGWTMVNGWHMMENLKSVKRIFSSPVDKYSVNKSLKRLRLNEAWSQFFCFEI